MGQKKNFEKKNPKSEKGIKNGIQPYATLHPRNFFKNHDFFNFFQKFGQRGAPTGQKNFLGEDLNFSPISSIYFRKSHGI